MSALGGPESTICAHGALICPEESVGKRAAATRTSQPLRPPLAIRSPASMAERNSPSALRLQISLSSRSTVRASENRPLREERMRL